MVKTYIFYFQCELLNIPGRRWKFNKMMYRHINNLNHHKNELLKNIIFSLLIVKSANIRFRLLL